MMISKSDLCETVTIRSFLGQGVGSATYGDLRTEHCYLEPSQARISTANGEDRIATLFGMFGAQSAIKISDELTWNGQRYEVIRADPLRDRGRTHHVEVYLTSKVG